jgi:hypothetical protein
MRLDLHTHSTASDGTLSPAELVRHAQRCGVEVLALTDHDSVDGIAEAAAAAEAAGVTIVPGVELSVGPHHGRDVHILGYFVDPSDERLQMRLRSLRDARLERAARMVAALNRAGYGIGLDEVLKCAGPGTVGRLHLARVLVSRRYAQSVDDAFERLVGSSGAFFEPKAAVDPAQAVEWLTEAGAVPVLAHPELSGVSELIPTLVEAGLVGVEAYHAEHTPEQRARTEQLARSYGLLVTGGSDFHDPDGQSAPLGSVEVPDEVWPALRAAAHFEPA